MKIAKVQVMIIFLECPECGENIEHPESGSYQFDMTDPIKESILECRGCGMESKTPKQILRESISIQPYHLGDFLEFFGPDAEIVSKILQITLTKRTRDEKQIPMAGVPYHAWDRYRQQILNSDPSIRIMDALTELPEELR